MCAFLACVEKLLKDVSPALLLWRTGTGSDKFFITNRGESHQQKHDNLIMNSRMRNHSHAQFSIAISVAAESEKLRYIGEPVDAAGAVMMESACSNPQLAANEPAWCLKQMLRRHPDSTTEGPHFVLGLRTELVR